MCAAMFARINKTIYNFKAIFVYPLSTHNAGRDSIKTKVTRNFPSFMKNNNRHGEIHPRDSSIPN